MNRKRTLVLLAATLSIAAGTLSVPSPVAASLPDSTGVTTRASVKSGGAQSDALAPASSDEPAFSADGRFVAFSSEASNLVVGDTNAESDVFVAEIASGAIERVSAQSSTQADGPSRSPSISADGRFVAFESDAPNLVPGDTNGVTDVLVVDRTTDRTTRLSVGAGGAQANGASGEVDISDSGLVVVFGSEATNLATGDGNGAADVFVSSRANPAAAPVTALVSVSETATSRSGNGASFSPSVSGDGAVLAFASEASDLAVGDANRTTDIFVRVLATSITTRESVPDSGAGGVEGDGPSLAPALSEDGRVVAFESEATNLVPGDANGVNDVFVRVRRGAPGTELASLRNDGSPSASPEPFSYEPSISADGSVVAFSSDAADLVVGDTNGATDVFLRTRTGTPGTTRASLADNEAQLAAGGFGPSLSGDGSIVAFTELTTLDLGAAVVLARNLADSSTRRVSATASGEAAGPAASLLPLLSSDGSIVAFTSTASDLVDGDTNRLPDAFVHDRRDRSTTRVSVGAGGIEANGASGAAALSADGRFVALVSTATNLVDADGDTNGALDVFLFDRMSKSTTRVSVGTGGAQADGSSLSPSLSADGRFVAFSSLATNLVDGDTNGALDVFLFDRISKSTTRVSLGPGGVEADGLSFSPSISGDGRSVAFTSDATNLVPGDGNEIVDVFVRDLAATTTARVSLAPDGGEAPGRHSAPVISGDGRSVVYHSSASNLVGGDTNEADDLFLYDRVSKRTERVNLGTGGEAADGSIGLEGFDAPAVSGDGRFVAFSSAATNLVPGDGNGSFDVFVRDRLLSATTRVSVPAPGVADSAGGDSLLPSISGDGRYVAFASDATNLVGGDTNAAVDVFVHDRTPIRGYWLAGADGGVFNYGDAGFHGSAGGIKLAAPVVGMAASPTGGGYWLAGADGGVFNYGDAGFFGSAGAIKLNQPIVGMAPTPTGKGYWLVARDGGIFNYGDAGFFGSAGAVKLNQPIVGMAPTPTGKGYWLVARDGGIFNYGDAGFFGSAGAIKLNQPIVGTAPTPTGKGYWLVARDGGIFNYGDAGFFGSAGAIKLAAPVLAMAASPTGKGYWLVAQDGGIFSYGDAAFAGSAGGARLAAPVVAAASR